MPDREKVIKGLKYCTHTDGKECMNCPYWLDADCVEALNADALALLKEQERQLNEYHKADAFLAVHGFWSDNPPYGVKTSVELERP